MKKVKLFCKTTLALATMLLLGGSNVWGAWSWTGESHNNGDTNFYLRCAENNTWLGLGYDGSTKVPWAQSDINNALVFNSAEYSYLGWRKQSLYFVDGNTYYYLNSNAGTTSYVTSTNDNNTNCQFKEEDSSNRYYRIEVNNGDRRFQAGVVNGRVNAPKTKDATVNANRWQQISAAQMDTYNNRFFYFQANPQVGVGEGSVVAQEVVSYELVNYADRLNTHSQTLTFSATPNAAQGYQFEGWYETSDCSGNRVSNANPYTPSVSNDAAGVAGKKTVTLYARFVAEQTPVIQINEGADAMLVDDAVAVASMFTTEHTPSLVYTLEDNNGVLSLVEGTLTALKVGTATIVVTQNAVPGIKYAQAKFTITVSKHDLVFTKSESLQTAYLVNDAALSLAELWTNNGTGGTTTYEITSFVAAEGEQTGATAPAIANNVLTLGEAGVLVLKASFTGSAKYKDGEDTHTITISRRTNGVLNVTGADIKNTWNQSINLSDYISKENTDGELVVGVSSDSEVATYDAETKQFALGIKTGTASFSISVLQTYLYEAVAAKTFTITANQSFYTYAGDIILAAGQNLQEFDHSGYLAALDATHNKQETEGVLVDLRAASKEYIAESVFSSTNVSFLMNNTGFDYDEWNYGWNNGAFGRDVENENVQAAHTVGGSLGSTTLSESAITQTLTLPAGRYTLSAQILVCQVGNANMFVKKVDASQNIASTNLTSTKEYTDLARYGSNVTLDFEIFEETTVVIGVWHPSTSGITWEGKAVRVDNFELQYVGKNHQSLTLVAENSQGYWATFSSDYDVEFSEDVTVYTVTVNGEAMELHAVEDRQVPANTGVLIFSEDDAISYVAVAPVAALEDNMLQPGTGGMTEGDNCRFYRLAYYDYANKTGLGFYYGPGCEDGEPFKCKAGTAYLAVPRTPAAPARFLLDRQDISTDLLNVNVNDNQGKKVMMNGVLYIIRDGKTYDSFGRMVK